MKGIYIKIYKISIEIHIIDYYFIPIYYNNINPATITIKKKKKEVLNDSVRLVGK